MIRNKTLIVLSLLWTTASTALAAPADLTDQQQIEQAYQQKKDSLEQLQQAYGTQHPEVARCLGNLGLLAFQLDSYT